MPKIILKIFHQQSRLTAKPQCRVSAKGKSESRQKSAPNGYERALSCERAKGNKRVLTVGVRRAA